eukprot:gnl/Spiro4/26277_TR13108_c0_g1_i1.p1 gnl/Spiro4/26277_TR13108_c0_g1~~gnl/Spiro4/26277_TR13108_c0_g1_i1.p1  ORF type:complete len:482 (-),score=119.70 gnl/Spiro4/26277_TR13108_c0_g1_i1:61-1470(-)
MADASKPAAAALRECARTAALDVCSVEFAQLLDSRDELASFREKFLIPRQKPDDPSSPEVVYLCGNSLGLQPKTTRAKMLRELDAWEKLGVNAHFTSYNESLPWARANEMPGFNAMLGSLIGAKESEVVLMNGLTVNLHLMMVSFYRPTQSRFRIVIEHKPFPSDLYAVVSQIVQRGFDPASALVQLRPRPVVGEDVLHTADIVDFLRREGESVALVMLPGVQFYTGQLLDIHDITHAGHAAGCLVGWDLAHAAGNVPLSLHDWDVDWACFCTYKYLNSGPGSTAGVFVHERFGASSLQELPRFVGWWGCDTASRFSMDYQFQLTPGAMGWQCSNIPIMTTVCVVAAVEIHHEAGVERLRQKSLQLTAFAELLVDALCSPADVVLITPREEAQRGCQLSLRFPALDVSKVSTRLEERGIVADVRRPDVVRFSPVPLYNSFQDVYVAVRTLAAVIREVKEKACGDAAPPE